MTLQMTPPPTAPRPIAPPPAPGGPSGRLPTPRPTRFGGLFTARTLLGRFRLLAAIIIGLAVIALVVSFLSLNVQAQNFSRVANTLTPSIAAAQELGQALEDMDARAADYQLTSRIDVTNPDFQSSVYGQQGLRAQSWNELENRRRSVDNALALLRSKVEGDTTQSDRASELDALNRIANRFYEYYARINLMRYELDQGHKEAALANYKSAEDILVGNLGQSPRDANGNSQEKVLKDNNWQQTNFTCVSDNCPADTKGKATPISFGTSGTTYDGIAANVHKLSVINQDRLDQAGSSVSQIFVFVAAALVLLAALVIAIYYAVVTHRFINLGFGLALLAGIVLAVALVLALGKASSDYRQIRDTDVQTIIQTSTIQQISADANADLSRLLLSPDSPGLDSTQPALTTDVKKAFSSSVLLASFNNKRQQVEQQLKTLGTDPAIWTSFSQQATAIQTNFNQKRLADAILIAVSPTPGRDGKQSARQLYNNFTGSIKTISDNYTAQFDTTACGAIGQSQFNHPCSAVGNGYLNLLQVLVWIMYPLVALFVAAGIWLTSRLF